MFSAVFSVCLLASPLTCDLHPPAIPAQASFSECLHEARNQAVLFSRQYRDRKITQITCRPAAPGKGR